MSSGRWQSLPGRLMHVSGCVQKLAMAASSGLFTGLSHRPRLHSCLSPVMKQILGCGGQRCSCASSPFKVPLLSLVRVPGRKPRRTSQVTYRTRTDLMTHPHPSMGDSSGKLELGAHSIACRLSRVLLGSLATVPCSPGAQPSRYLGLGREGPSESGSLSC